MEFVIQSFTVSSPIYILKRQIHVPSMPKINSVNHDKTYSAIIKGLSHPSISYEVRVFIKENQNLDYPYLFTMDELNIPPLPGGKGENSYLFSNKYKPNSKDKNSLENIAGVYLIRVLNTNYYYIGSATNIFIRFLQHRDKGRLSSSRP